MKAILIGGLFDEKGGIKSEFISNAYDYMVTCGLTERASDFICKNGGNIEALENFSKVECYDRFSFKPNYNNSFKGYDFIFWLADTNGKFSSFKDLKANNPNSVLVICINNIDNRHTLSSIFDFCIDSRADFIVEFNCNSLRLFDFLGNMILDNCDYSQDIEKFSRVLSNEVKYLKGLNILSRVRLGDSLNVPNIDKECVNFKELIIFYSIGLNRPFIKNKERFALSASFCDSNKRVYILDNRYHERISSDSFMNISITNENVINYYGDIIPPYDSALHLQLYRFLGHIRYIICGPAYIDNVPKTVHKVYCNSVEGFSEVINLFDDELNNYYANNYHQCFCINLKGYGFIAGWDTLKTFSEYFGYGKFSSHFRMIPFEELAE